MSNFSEILKKLKLSDNLIVGFFVTAVIYCASGVLYILWREPFIIACMIGIFISIYLIGVISNKVIQVKRDREWRHRE